MRALVRKALAVDQLNRSLGAEIETGADATFVRSTAFPIVHDLNHVAGVRVHEPAALDALFARADAAFAHCRHRQVVVDPDTPPELEARLVHEGWDADASLVMLLEGALRGTAPRHAIRRIAREDDWAAYARLKRLDWRERAARLRLGELPEVGEALARSYRLKSPPLRYWLACIDDEPRGFMSSWEGPEGVGQVEDLFVEAPFRHRGLATALIHHATAECRAHGADAVVIVAHATDTPKTMYAAMGFRPLSVVRKYTRGV